MRPAAARPSSIRSRAQRTYAGGAGSARIVPSALRPDARSPSGRRTPSTTGGTSAGGCSSCTSRSVDVVAVEGEALPAEEAADGDRHLLERPHRLLGQGADLVHPRGHAVAETGDEAARVEPAERRDLHRAGDRVAEDARA